jgi:hypothetical protein
VGALVVVASPTEAVRCLEAIRLAEAIGRAPRENLVRTKAKAIARANIPASTRTVDL